MKKLLLILFFTPLISKAQFFIHPKLSDKPDTLLAILKYYDLSTKPEKMEMWGFVVREQSGWKSVTKDTTIYDDKGYWHGAHNGWIQYDVPAYKVIKYLNQQKQPLPANIVVKGYAFFYK